MIYKKSDYKKENQKGMALVMALLILSLVMVSVLALANIIVGEVKMSLNTVNSIGAFHAAESGIEKALFYLKYSRQNSDFSSFNALSGTSESVINGEYQFVTVSNEAELFTAYQVSTSSPANVDIIDPAGDIGSIAWPDTVAQYRTEWSIDNCFPYHASDKLEITLSSFMAEFASPKTDTKVAVCGCDYGENTCNPVIYSDMEVDRYYRVAFRPLDSTVAQIVFDIRNAADESIGIKSKIEVVVNGKYKNSQYRLRARVPALAPVSDIFNYVIFSEQDIIKNL